MRRSTIWRIVAWGTAAVLVTVLVSLLLLKESSRSHTADEPLHLVRGVAYWQTGDPRLSYAHPPLANLATTATIPNKQRIDFPSFPGWKTRDVLRLSRDYFRADFAAARKDLSIARATMAAYSTFFACWFAVWIRRHYDGITALLALALFVGCPTLLAHANLATTDLPATATIFIASTQYYVYLARRGVMPLLRFATALGLVLATKHTGIPLLAIYLAGALWVSYKGIGRYAVRLGRRTFRLLLRDWAVVAVVIALIINAVYGFQRTGWTVQQIVSAPEPHNWISRHWDHDILRPTTVLPRWLPIPLPYDYIVGVATIAAQNKVGHLSYLAGFRFRRNPLYFPVLLAIKTPLLILVLLGACVWLYRRGILRPQPLTMCLVYVATSYLLLAMTSRINIGVRHVLPLYPIMVLLAARAAGIIVRMAGSGQILLRASLLLALAPIPSLLAFPHYLGYFNILVGGPWGGSQISVIGEDWGQDVAGLAKVVDRTRPLYYHTGFTLRIDELKRFGVDVRYLRCNQVPPTESQVALHRSDIVRRGDHCFAWRTSCKVKTTVNHHIVVYECASPRPQTTGTSKKQ